MSDKPIQPPGNGGGIPEHLVDQPVAIQSLRWLMRCDVRDLEPIAGILHDRFPNQLLHQVQRLYANNGASVRPEFMAGLESSVRIPEGSEVNRLWFGLYPASVAMMIGETGAGKSTLLYNLGVHAARNEPLWGIPFGLNRPLRVMYIDPENSGNWREGDGGQCARKLDRIGGGRPKDLWFHDGRGVDLSDPGYLLQVRQAIQEHQFDLVILDPIANLFNTSDENDNAEAARQMRALTDLSRQTGACLLCCHHTGKDPTGNYGRGASARLAAADVGLTFRVRGGSDEDDDDFKERLIDRSDVTRLQIVKNRVEGKGSLFLGMAGQDRFDRVTIEQWKDAPRSTPEKPTKVQEALEEIPIYLQDGVAHPTEQVFAAMKKEGIGKMAVMEALGLLVTSGVVTVITGSRNSKHYILTSFYKEPV